MTTEQFISMRLEAKRFIPFEPTPGTDQHGFTEGETEQQVEYPEHCNIPTRIYFDPLKHDVMLQRDEHGRHSLLLIPKEHGPEALQHTTAVDGYRVVDKTVTVPR
jgi:hypothetical protein